MKREEQMRKQIRLVAVLAMASTALILFQNCGTAFTSVGTPASAAFAPGSSGSTGTTNTSAVSIQLSWTAPAGSQPTGYDIQQSSDGINFNQIQQVSGSTLTTSVSGLSGAKYYFKVLAYNANGTTSSATLTADLRTATNSVTK